MNRIVQWFFPLVLGALLMCGTELFPPLFNPTTRWLYVLMAFMLACIARYSQHARNTSVFALLTIYLVWCLLTAIWSDIPELSLNKIMAAALVTPGLFMLGFSWGRQQSNVLHSINAFYWLAPLALTVAVSGKVGQGLLETGQDYYTGLAGNSNNLGWMMAISLPFLVWKAFDHNQSAKQRSLFFLLMGVAVYYLLLSQSRAAMMLAFCAILGFFIAGGMSNRVKMAGLSLFLVFGAFLFIPNLFDLAFTKYILKGSGSDLAYAIEQSRGEPFEDSLNAAEEGGLLGAGYGISIGASPLDYRGGFTATGYGREKVSSPLAIVEETGIIGLSIVVLIWFNIFSMALRAYRSTSVQEERMLVGTLAGLIFGMMIHTNLEAWWVAPGSGESMFFWLIAGMSYAVFQMVIDKAGRIQHA